MFELCPFTVHKPAHLHHLHDVGVCTRQGAGRAAQSLNLVTQLSKIYFSFELLYFSVLLAAGCSHVVRVLVLPSPPSASIDMMSTTPLATR